MIGIIIVGLAIGIAIYWQILENRMWNRIFREHERQLRKKLGKQKDYIFVNEESKMRCQYCGKQISKEEYENERYGYCYECTDDLMTEEEEDVWGI